MATADEQGYNGWTNYETWSVNLWLTNEPGTSEELTKIAQAPKFPPVSAYGDGLWFAYEFEKADYLKEQVSEWYDLPTEGLAGDLVGAALSEVNWKEIIDNHKED